MSIGREELDRIEKMRNKTHSYTKPHLDQLEGEYYEIACPSCGNPDYEQWELLGGYEGDAYKGTSWVYRYRCPVCEGEIIVNRAWRDFKVIDPHTYEKRQREKYPQIFQKRRGILKRIFGI